jgi:protein-disulfide isomerase
MANKKKARDMQGIVVSTILILVLALGVYGVVNQFLNKDTTSKQTADKIYAIDYTGQPFIGKKDAPVKIMEYGDFKCPICKTFHDTIYPQLKKEYIDTGKAALYFTNTQIIGPDSLTAGEAGESVFKQNPSAFWKYYETIYNHQGNESKEWATPTFLVNLIKNNIPEVNAKQVEQDLAKKTYEKVTVEDNTKFGQLGIDGVPAVFVNGKFIGTGLSYPDFKAAIEKALKK